MFASLFYFLVFTLITFGGTFFIPQHKTFFSLSKAKPSKSGMPLVS